MKAMKDAATPDSDVDAAEYIPNPEPIEHPRKV